MKCKVQGPWDTTWLACLRSSKEASVASVRSVGENENKVIGSDLMDFLSYDLKFEF